MFVFTFEYIVDESDRIELWVQVIKRDIYFSMGTRYFCDAGCHVCYIKDNLASIRSNSKTLYPVITDKHEEMWEDVFSYFDYFYFYGKMKLKKQLQPLFVIKRD